MKISAIETTGSDKLPVIIYTEEAFKKMQLFMKTKHSIDKEFMFVGTVRTKDNYYIIEDFYLPPNKDCSGSYCESGDNYDKWFFETFKTLEEKKSLRCHVHSHVNMKAFPSGTDSKQIMDLYKNVSNYYIQIIINRKFENYVAIYKDGIKYEEVPQMVQIRDMVFEFVSGEKAVPYCELSDGDYTIKDGMITIDEYTSFNVYTGDWEVHSGELTYKNGAISYIPRSDVLGECNALFDKMIEKKVYQYSHNNYPAYNNPNYRAPQTTPPANNQLPPKTTDVLDRSKDTSEKVPEINKNDPFMVIDESNYELAYAYLREQGVID